jgi:tetratricopeptide (TPR) repeat protein
MTNKELLKQGIAAVKAGDKSKAQALMARLVKADPDSEQGWLILGHCLSDPIKREYCFQKVLKINPSNQVAKRFLDELYAAKPKPQALVVEPAKNREASGNIFVRARASVASFFARAGNWQSAGIGFALGSLFVGLPLLLIFRSLQPPALFDRVALFVVNQPLLIGVGDLQETEIVLSNSTATAALTATPASTPVLTPTAIFNIRFQDTFGDILQAQRYMENKDYAQAVLMWDAVIEVIPEYAEAYFQRGLAYYGLTFNQRVESEFLANLEQSYLDMTHAIELDPNNGDYYYERAGLLKVIAGAEEFLIYGYPWYEKSFEDTLKAIDLGTSYEFANRSPGFDLINLGRCEEALDFFTELQAAQAPDAPASAGINTGFAESYLCLGQYQRALDHIEAAIEIRTSAPRIWTRLHILYNLGRYNQIIEELTESIEQTAAYGGGRYYFRAAAYYELGQTELALEDLAIGAGNTWGRYWFNAYVLGQLALDEGDEDGALYWLQLAEASIAPERFPDLHADLLEEIAALGGEPLFSDEDAIGIEPAIAFEEVPVIPDHIYVTPTPSSQVLSAELANYLGTGVMYLKGGDFPALLFRPAGTNQISEVISLIIKVEGGQPGQESTLQASYLSLDGGWGGFETLIWGENEIRNPQRYVDSQGYIYIAIRNFGTAPQLITNMSIRLVAVDQNGVQKVYGFRE